MADFSTIIIEDDGGAGIARFTRADHFRSGDTGDAVEQLNAFLIAAGFLTEEELAKQGGRTDIVGTGTKNAAIFFSRSVGQEAPNEERNIISADMLRGMRTFLRDEGVAANAESYTGNDGGRNLIDDFGPSVTSPETTETPTDVTTEAPVDDSPAADPTGSAANIPGIMSGGTLTRIPRDEADDLWGMTYVVNGIEHVYTFDSPEAMFATLGDDAISSGKYGFMTLAEDTINDGNTWLLGDAAAFAGQAGSYGVYFDDIMQEAALEAGVRAPGMVGDFLSQPDIQRIMAEGQVGGWSSARIQAEIRGTDYYQNTLYPGINTFLQTGSPNPEAEYLQYVKNVESSLDMLGYQRDANGTYRTLAGEMLGKGISAEEFSTFAPTFVRAEQSQEFASALNKWTEQDLNQSLSFEDWFGVLEGSSTPEMQQVVEKATLQYAADNSSTALDDDTITRLAGQTDLSEQQMRIAFSQAEEALLSVGNRDLQRFGLSQEALVSAAFGLESVGADPLTQGTGDAFTAVEIRRRADKAARELGLQDDRKAKFFVGFDSFGTPTRQGLAAVRPEAG